MQQSKQLKRLFLLAGFALAFIPSFLGASELKAENNEDSRSVHLSLPNYAKRNERSANWQKRESNISPGEVVEQTVVGGSPHRSSPRSFLRFGKRSAPKYDVDNDYESLGDNPDFQAIVVKKGGDNYLRFGKRLLPDELEDRLLLMALAGEHLDKRSKDFLRFG